MSGDLHHIEPDASGLRDSYRLLAYAYCKLIGIKPDDVISDAGHEAWELVAYDACAGRCPAADEIERLRKFVQFVADCSNDPGVRAEALKMGAKP